MAVIATSPYQQFFDDNGDPLVGGKVYTYRAGTTVPKNTFTDADGLTPMPNPIILDAAGRTVFFINGSYKYVVTDASDNVIRTVDNITSFNVVQASAPAFQQTFSGNGSQTSFTLSDDMGTDEKAIMVFVNSTPTTLNVPFSQILDSIAAQTVFTVSQDLGTDENAIQVFVKDPTKGYEVQIFPQFTINGTTLTLGVSPGAQTGAVMVFKNPILGNTRGFEIQPPTAFTVNGTSLTFAVAPPSGTNNIMVFAPSTMVGAASAAAAAAEESADNAANSATAAAASASSAATSATNASNSATAAAGSASSASTSATNAATSASSASTSATNASNSATSAANSANIATAATAWQYDYSSTTTSSDPGSGVFRFNNATLASVTALYISDTTALGQAIDPELALWDDSSSVSKGRLKFVKRSDPTTFALYYITGNLTDNTSWVSYTLNYVSGSGTFSDGDSIAIQFVQTGDAGSPLATTSIRWADTVGGTATNVALTFSPALGALVNGQSIAYRSASASVASMTVSVDGGSNIALRKINNAPTAAGDWFQNDVVILTYNSTLNLWNISSNTGNFLYGVVASASTISLPSGDTFVNVTGTTGINAISNIFDGQAVALRHNATLTYTASGTMLLPYGGATLTVNSGDILPVYRDGSGFTRIPFAYRATQAAARTDLGLGTVATLNVGTANGNVVQLDAVGLPAVSGAQLTNLPNQADVYISPDQTIVSAGSFTVSHNLGQIPVLNVWLRCATAEHGYSIGDIVKAPDVQQVGSTAAGYGLSVVSTATAFTCRFGNAAAAFYLQNKTTGAPAAATNSNWTVFIVADRVI